MIYLSKKSVYFNVAVIRTKRDQAQLKAGLDKLPGVFSVSVNPETSNVGVDYDSTGTDTDDIKHQIEVMGFDASLVDEEDHTM